MSDEFFCPDEDGFFPFDDQCTGDYYVCVGGNYAIQVNKIVMKCYFFIFSSSFNCVFS